jgi:hypothetical protein
MTFEGKSWTLPLLSLFILDDNFPSMHAALLPPPPSRNSHKEVAALVSYFSKALDDYVAWLTALVTPLFLL